MSGKIVGLFYKEKRGFPMRKVSELELIEGFGIEKDVNANRLSSRQILIIRKEDLDCFEIPFGGLRENIVIEGLSEKELQSGNALCMGDAVIRLNYQCEPCRQVKKFVEPKAIIGRRGVLGSIIKGGNVNFDTPIFIRTAEFEAIPDKPVDRFAHYVKQIPEGKVVTYQEVLIMAGLSKGYLRGVPNYFKQISDDVPIHRILDTEGKLILHHIPYQKEALLNENIEILKDPSINKWKVSLEKYLFKK